MKYNLDYIDDLFRDEFITLSGRSYAYRDDIYAQKYRNAIVLPFQPDLNCSTKGMGGVLDENNRYVDISSTSQENLMPCGYALEQEPKCYDETVIYLGYYIMQWGHFLVDFVPRLWYFQQNYHGEKLLVLTGNRKSRINGNFLELLSLFGITEDKIHYVYEPERYSSIIVPEMSMVRPVYYSRQSEELYRYIVEKATATRSYPKYDKIYFSRSKLKKAAMTEIGEPEIEHIYRKNGYKIIYPERCSFKELVFYISNCREFVSLSGTIPHNIVFAKPDTKVVILNKTYRINTIQLMLNAQAGISPIYVDTNICLFPASPGSGPFWMEIEDNFIRYAKQNGLKLPMMVTSQNRIVEYYRRQKRASRLKKYALMYVRLRDRHLDIGGSIVGAARPDEKFADKPIFYFYREKVKEINTNTNLISFLTNLYHYVKGTSR